MSDEIKFLATARPDLSDPATATARSVLREGREPTEGEIAVIRRALDENGDYMRGVLAVYDDGTFEAIFGESWPMNGPDA